MKGNEVLMPEITKENKEYIKKKLEFIGLDLNNIPESLKNIEDIDFRPDLVFGEDTYKVYKHVPVRDIQILFSKTNRMNSIQEKYEKVSTLLPYLEPVTDKDMVKHMDFLKMIDEVSIPEIEKIADEQEKLKDTEPFLVKYEKNYLWEIYYSNKLNKYFMLVTTEDKDYAGFFYLLKEKLKENNNGTIFVPIRYTDYSNKIFNKAEFKDIERYIFNFTREWPMIYEVYDKNSELSIQICGKTLVYEKLESIYRIKLETKEKAGKFFKLIKALFILKTEFPHDYEFELQIAQDGGIEFIYNTKIITYEYLSTFVKEEYKKKAETYRILKKQEKVLKEVLDNLKRIEKEQEKEYLYKQNQVATYLECRKSFFGKVKYFFKGRKKKSEETKTEILDAKLEVNDDEIKEEYEREFYTLEDLIKICNDLNQTLNSVKNIRMDKRALELKNNQMKVKILNATKYIEEIDSHKKSIFEFWKFANKDEVAALESAIIEEKANDNKKRAEELYDYIDDREEIGEKIDRHQREILSKEEADIVYLTRKKLITPVNAVKNGGKYNFSADLENIKNDLRSLELLFETNEYDIFGNSVEDKTKTNILGNKKHREKKKDEYRIIEVNKDTDTIGFVSSLHGIVNSLDKIFEKSSLGIKLNVYQASVSSLVTSDYEVFNINPENALLKLKNEPIVNLYNIKLKSNTPAIGLSNIIYYDNFNQTLPYGMNISDEVLLDMSKFELELKKQRLFRVNVPIDDRSVKTATICAYEYELK